MVPAAAGGLPGADPERDERRAVAGPQELRGALPTDSVTATPRPPADDVVAAATDASIEARRPLRATGLSVLEHVTIRAGAGPRAAVLKTVDPLLDHERRVYRLVQDKDICAVRVLADGPPGDSHDGWLLLADAGGESVDTVTAGEAAQVLGALGHVHRRFADAEIDDLPQRDLGWLCEHADETTAHLRFLIGAGDLDLVDGAVDAYRDRLAASASAPSGLHLVHGDFDPGNLVRLRGGRLAALDWGLSHRNTPLVDLAHMVERFGHGEQMRIAEGYLDAMGIEAAHAGAALERGLLAHRAFFVWWHSTVITQGAADVAVLCGTIAARVRQVAAAGLA